MVASRSQPRSSPAQRDLRPFLKNLKFSTSFRAGIALSIIYFSIGFEAITVSPSFSLKTTTASNQEELPQTIPGAFERIHGNEVIIYWKLLSEEEWQSDQKERAYHLFVRSSPSEEWRLRKSVDWNVAQTEIRLLEGQTTIIKIQAQNHNGYAEMTIPCAGIPAPTTVTVAKTKDGKAVKVSWDSEFTGEVAIFWCKTQREYKCCQDGSFGWFVPMDISNNSVSVPFESMHYFLRYKFGVSVSHLNIHSGIEWSLCHEVKVAVMRPCNLFGLVGQEITLCCLNLFSSGDTIDLRNAAFSCPKNQSLMSEPYTIKEENKICTNVSIYSPHPKMGMCNCTYGQDSASRLLGVDEPPSISNEEISCTFDGEHLTCWWTRVNFNNPKQWSVELLYNNRHESGNKNCEIKVRCQLDPPCQIQNLLVSDVGYLYYNISLMMIYKSFQGPVQFESPWKEFYVPHITKYPVLPVKIKDRNETCITLVWTQEESSKQNVSDIIQFEYMSHSETNKGNTPNFTTTFLPPERMIKLCDLTPFTQYTIQVRIRPSTSHVWSDAFIVNGSTTDSVPARSPSTISGAFKRIPSEHAAIVYWKLLPEKEWQSYQKERGYNMYVWSTLTKNWMHRQSESWKVTQTKIDLLDEQDTIIKIQAYNRKGDAEKYSEIKIPFKEIPAPVDVTAMINNEEKVKISWASEFKEEVVLFWCLQLKENECVQDTIDWRVRKSVSNNSDTLSLEDVDPSRKYMFGVSVSRSNIPSGIKWTNCTDTRDGIMTLRSSCSQQPTLTDKGTSTVKVSVIVSSIAAFLAVVGIIATVIWARNRWRSKSKHFAKPSSNLNRIESDTSTDLFLGERERHPPSERPYKNFEYTNEIFQSTESTTDDTERSLYHRIGIETSCTILESEEIEMVEHLGEDEARGTAPPPKSLNLNSKADISKDLNEEEGKKSGDALHHHTSGTTDEEDKDSGDVSHYHTNGNTNEGEDSGDALHYHTKRNIVEEDENSGDVLHYHTKRNIVEEDEDRGDVFHYHTKRNIVEEDEDSGDVLHYHTKRNTVEEDEDSGDVLHYHTKRNIVEEDEDSGDVLHYHTKRNIVEEDEDSGDVFHYHTKRNIVEEDEDSGDVLHYHTKRNIVEEDEDSGDVLHYHTKRNIVEEDEDSGDILHYHTKRNIVEENEDSGDVSHYHTSGNTDEEGEDSGDFPHYHTKRNIVEEDEDSGDVPHYNTNGITNEREDSGDVPHYHTKRNIVEEDKDSGDVPHYHTKRNIVEEDKDSGDVPHYHTNGNTIDEDKDSGDVLHYHTNENTIDEDEDSGDVLHYHTKRNIIEENEDSGDDSHYHTKWNIVEEGEDSSDVSH